MCALYLKTMNIVRPVILLICFTVKTYGTLGMDERRESIVGILLRTIEKEILEVNDLVRKNVEFKEPRCNGSLERVFRNRLDLFFGVPREVLTSGMDLTNADMTVLNEFFRPYHAALSPCPTRANADHEGAVNGSRDSPRGSPLLKTRKSLKTNRAITSRPNGPRIRPNGQSPSGRPAGRTRTRVSSSSSDKGGSGRTSNSSTAVTVGGVNVMNSTAGSRMSLSLIGDPDCGGVDLTARVPVVPRSLTGPQRNGRSESAARAGLGGLVGPVADVGTDNASRDDRPNDVVPDGPDVHRADCARQDVLPEGLDGGRTVLTPETAGAGSRANRSCSGPKTKGRADADGGRIVAANDKSPRSSTGNDRCVVAFSTRTESKAFAATKELFGNSAAAAAPFDEPRSPTTVHSGGVRKTAGVFY
uniref:Uncharacterized protein n=1 Tax=Sipha flava TaxID=143950 RepID=A0A2S2QA91_9HEMI